MGHRTLLAYERDDGYDVRYAHWGVDPDDLTAATPLGGRIDDSWARDRTVDLLEESKGGRLFEDETPGTVVDPAPIDRADSFEDVCALLDPIEHEALYVVASDWTVRTYLVFAIERPTPTGALIGYEDEHDAAYLRGWIAGVRTVRDVSTASDDAVVRALRWLSPDRGTLVWLGDERAV